MCKTISNMRYIIIWLKKICLPREMNIMIHPGILVQNER